MDLREHMTLPGSAGPKPEHGLVGGIAGSTAMFRRPAVIAACLLVIYLVASIFIDPKGHLITDVGGKSIALEAMVQRGDWNPDIGYWLAESDPEGQLFPFDKTRLTTDGQWVNTTSLTMIYVARGFWELGGLRAALMVPMIGSIVAALSAGGIERRLDPAADGAISTWLVGMATPAFVYALDFWEHSLALGLLGVATLKVIDLTEPGAKLTTAIVGGLCYGFAATMRQEAMVYAFVAGLVLLGVLATRFDVKTSLKRAFTLGASGVAVLVGYTLLEIQLMGEPFRSSRGVAAASEEIKWTRHVGAAAITTLGPLDGSDIAAIAVGGLLVGSLCWVAHLVMTKQYSRFAIQCASVLWVSYFLALMFRGPSFVPGLGPTTPLAVIGLVAALHSRRWFFLALALCPMPLVWLTGYPSGSIIQWGGRYQLLSGLVLTTLAVSLLKNSQPKLLAVVALVGLLVTGFGVTWVGVRSERVARQWEVLDEVTTEDEVVIWRDQVVAREAGAVAYGRRWLGASFEEDQALAAELLSEMGVKTFVWIDTENAAPRLFAGFDPVEDLGRLDFFGLRMTRYDTDGNQP